MKKVLNYFTVILMLLLAAGNSFAEDLKAGGALDAIMVIDSSGSMLLTDPGRLRDEGAKLFIQSLKPGDKVGIIEFSDSANIVHAFGDYNRENDKTIADEIGKIENDGIYTDLLSGIKLAQETLKKFPAGDRERIVVLFSDGKMEPDPAKASAEAETQELFNTYLPQLKADGIKVHTLALSEKADKELLAQIAASTEGISIYASDANLINQAFTNLFLAVKKPQVLPLSSKGFKIDADIQEATFYINREDPDQEITITSPSGKRYASGLTDASIKWFKSQQFEVVTIFAPEAGNWKMDGIKSQDSFATLLTNLKLVTDWPNVVNMEEGNLLQARLYEGDKPVVLHGMSGNLEYAFQIVPTDKISEPIIKEFLTDDGKGGDKRANDGIFSKLVSIEDPGQYKLKVVAHSPTFDRYQHLPFQVKERLVNLSVESHSPHAAKAAEHGDEHAKDEHADEGHGEDEHADEHGKDEHAAVDKEEHAEEESAGGEDEYFVAKLSPEAKELKKLEVKLLAIDSSKSRYVIEMHAGEDGFVYEIPTNLLPASGYYDVEVNISGILNKKSFKAVSQRIKYNLQKAGEEVTIVKKEEHKSEAPVENKETSALVYIALVTILNLVLGGVAFGLFKKASAGPSVTVPVFEDAAITTEAIKTLKDRISITDIDLNDPMYSGSYTPSPESNKEAAGAEEPSADLTAAVQEPQAEEAEAAPEETPQEQG